MHLRAYIAAASFLALTASPALAVPITATFEGQVIQIVGGGSSALFPQAHLLDAASLTFTYETDTAAFTNQGHQADYHAITGPITLVVGGHTVVAGTIDGGDIGVVNDGAGGDELFWSYFLSGVPGSVLLSGVNIDSQGTMFSSLALPTSIPFADLEQRTVTIAEVDSLIKFMPLSITLAPVSAVPEPGTLALAALGGLGLLRARRRH